MTESTYIPPPDVERFDATTGETTNRGVALDAPSRPHDVRAEREAAMEDFCYRANVVLRGPERALELWRAANQPWHQET